MTGFWSCSLIQQPEKPCFLAANLKLTYLYSLQNTKNIYKVLFKQAIKFAFFEYHNLSKVLMN